jgi:hypothetical protein
VARQTAPAVSEAEVREHFSPGQVSILLRLLPFAPPAEPPHSADAILTLAEAAAYMGEKPGTFRRRHEYRKALVSRPGERRRRYSKAVLDRINADRLAANSAS